MKAIDVVFFEGGVTRRTGMMLKRVGQAVSPGVFFGRPMLVLLFVLLGLVAGTGALALMQPRWEAVCVMGVEPAPGGSLADSVSIQAALATSDEVLQDAVSRLRLGEDQAGEELSASSGQGVGQSIATSWRAVADTLIHTLHGTGNTETGIDAIAVLREGLKVKERPRSGVVEVRHASGDSAFSARASRAVAEASIEAAGGDLTLTPGLIVLRLHWSLPNSP